MLAYLLLERFDLVIYYDIGLFIQNEIINDTIKILQQNTKLKSFSCLIISLVFQQFQVLIRVYKNCIRNLKME